MQGNRTQLRQHITDSEQIMKLHNSGAIWGITDQKGALLVSIPSKITSQGQIYHQATECTLVRPAQEGRLAPTHMI